VIISRSAISGIKLFQAEVLEKVETHILCSMTFFFVNDAVYEINIEIYRRAGQATDYNTGHAHGMLDY
jgi:hypothetical protein